MFSAGTQAGKPHLVRLALVAGLAVLALPAAAGATVYYVSSSAGSDLNTGTSSGQAFETLAHVNGLTLAPGDEVRLRCGDVWRGETLVVHDSGTAGSPITVTSDPPGCAERPVVSGAHGISGWIADLGNVYVADLDDGANAGLFPFGVNQLFRAGSRLPFGRWPNLDAPGGGYSTIDSQPVAGQFVDAELPAGDWTGAIVHHRSERWLLLSRQVLSSSPSTLDLNDAASCRDGCAGWGYFLNNHRATLDRDGEWFYEASTNRVLLYSTTGAPANGEVSGSLLGDGAGRAGVVVGGDHTQNVDHVTVDNLEVREWSGNGIQLATPLRDDEQHFITVTANRVVDVAQVGIRMASFVFNPLVGPNGWRGGTDGVVSGNVVDGANLHGIEIYSRDTEVSGNLIADVAMLENLVADGMGCGLTGTACGINGNGVRIKVDVDGWSGSGNTVSRNTIGPVGNNGVDVFGPFNLIEENVIDLAGSTLGESAGVRVFGSTSYAVSPAHDVTIRDNVIRDTLGNSDGCAPPLDGAWGHGVYIDNFSDAIEVVGNTLVGAAAYGFQFNSSRGTATGNTLFDNSQGPLGGPHCRLLDGADVSVLGNVFFGRVEGPPLLSIDNAANLTAADDNYYFNPRDQRVIKVRDVSNIPMTLADWQALSGLDGGSVESFYSLEPLEPNVAELFVNDAASPVVVPLAGAYLDLDQSPVAGSLALGPFESRVLIGGSGLIFADGFESGDTAAWSAAVP